MNDIMGVFGGTVSFLKEKEDEVTAHVIVNEEAMLRWTLQYGSSVKILSPLHLQNDIKKELSETWRLYEK